MIKLAAVLSAVAVTAGCVQTPPAPSAQANAQLAPTGALRVAVLTSNPIIGNKDAKSGELKGTTIDLGRALAERAGVPARMIEYTAVGKLMEDAKTGAWDVAVIAIDPARRDVVDFAPAHLAADGFLTVLVPPGSTARSMADIDRPGVRAATLPGSRVLDDAFAGLRLSFALPKNRSEAARFVSAFVEEAKASGAVQRAIDAAGVGGDVRVAPAE